MTSARQARVLAKPLRARLLAACVPCERSLTALAELTGESLPKLHYHVDRLLSAGLLTVSREQPRAGRRIRFFRAVAASFLVPQELMEATPGDALAARLRAELEHQRGAVALRYAADAQGRLDVRLVREAPERQSKSIELWQIFNLTPRQRDGLAAELTEVFARYARQSGGEEVVLAHAALVGLPRDFGMP